MINDPRQVLAMIPAGARVLDIGAADSIFPRANAVLDILPYAERTPGPLADMPEQFGPDDWYCGDVCDEAAWRPFRDKEFDFVICSHLLEDVRDPLFVCRQMIRVGKAGYLESPSRFRECGKVHADDLMAGWEHHRWILDCEDNTLIFTAKNPAFNLFDCIPEERRIDLQRPELGFIAVRWEGSFDYIERCQKGSTWEIENACAFYRSFPYANAPSWFYQIQNAPKRPETFAWATHFKLPLESQIDAQEALRRHGERREDLPLRRYHREPKSGWRARVLQWVRP